MNILVDLDGTVVKYNFPKLIRKWFNVKVPATSEIFLYSIEDYLGTSSAKVAEMFDVEVFAKPDFIPGSVKALETLIAGGNNIIVYSNRVNFMTVPELEKWLDDNGIPYHSVATNKTLPTYAHAFVDDSPIKLMSVHDAIEVKNLILFDQPWNRMCLNITGKLVRAKNWKEVSKLIGHSDY